MSVIYKPTGMAREYSPYALNLYIGCSHHCVYCYAPHCLQKSSEDYFGVPKPRHNIISLLESDLKRNIYTEQILISFVGDVYCNTADDGKTVREALQLLNDHRAPVAVLSKGGERMLRDLDIFKAFGDRIIVGTTLTFLNEQTSREWEPYAALPYERLNTLKILHDNGIRTFASLEPTIDPKESLSLIKKTLELDCVDHYKIGKINNYGSTDKWQNWHRYIEDCIALLRPTEKQVYYKECLRKYAADIEFTKAESDPDAYIVKSIGNQQLSLFDLN